MADPYFALPPFESDGEVPASPSPTATPAPTDPPGDEVDDGSLDLSVPDPEEPEEEDAEEEAPDGDESEAGEPDDQEWLIERARKADEYERLLAQQKEQGEEQAAVAFWDDKLQKANHAFAAREKAIYQHAEENSLNPVGYIREQMAQLRADADVWYGQYWNNREQALGVFEMRREVPRFAARVVEHYKLPDSVIDELLEYAPEQMEREAQKIRARLIKERKQQKQIDQLKRKEAARKLASQTVAPGSGRAATGKEFSEMTDEERYFSIPWTRGR